jgi:hypothetical protein
MASFLIDALLVVMLLFTSGFLFLVNKRLKVLRSGQQEINALMSEYSRTIDETEASTRRLVESATQISVKLADDLDRSKVVAEDVRVLLESATRAGERLEDSIRHARLLVRRLDDGPQRRPVTLHSVIDDDDGDGDEEVGVAPAEEVAMPETAPEPPPAPATDDEAESTAPRQATNAFYARLRTL